MVGMVGGMATGEDGGNRGRVGGAAVRSTLGRGVGTSEGKSVGRGKGAAGWAGERRAGSGRGHWEKHMHRQGVAVCLTV